MRVLGGCVGCLQRPFARGEALHTRTNAGINEALLRDAAGIRLGEDERKDGVDPLKNLRQLASVRIIYLNPAQAWYDFLVCDILSMPVNMLPPSKFKVRGFLRTFRDRAIISCFPVARSASVISRATSVRTLVRTLLCRRRAWGKKLATRSTSDGNLNHDV